MLYNKLVRDNIPDYIQAKGQKVSFHVAETEEYGQKLFAKLSEEAEELISESKPEEIADVLEVLEAIAELKNYDWEEIKQIKEKKKQERGGFSKRIILEES